MYRCNVPHVGGVVCVGVCAQVCVDGGCRCVYMGVCRYVGMCPGIMSRVCLGRYMYADADM